MTAPERPGSERLEKLRLEYQLTESSLVLDVGGYHGHFTAAIRQRYQCRVIVYEALPRYVELLTERFKHDPGVLIRPYGLAEKDKESTFGLDGDRTGLFAATRERTKVQLRDAATELEGLEVALMKINVEGGEYAILERLMETNRLSQIQYLQVQFHCLREDHEQRHDAIRKALATTHSCTWRVPWTWESWTLKK